MRDTHEVARAQRLLAQVRKAEACGAHGHERHGDLAANAFDNARLPRLATRDPEPHLIHRRAHIRPRSEGIDLLAGKFQPPVILLARQSGNNRLFLQQRNEG